MGFKLAGVLIVVMLAMLAGGHWYYKDTQARIATLTESKAFLETAVATNEATIDALQADYEAMRRTNEQLNREFAAIRRQNEVLADKLSRHDLGVLGSSKPGLVENVINGASDKAGRCFELLSGAELTENERNANSANAFNSECPWLYDTLVLPGRM